MTNGSSTYIGVNVDFLEDILKDPPIRSAAKFSQICQLWRVDYDHCMIIWGDKEFMDIRNWDFGSI